MIINLPKLGPVEFRDNLTDAEFQDQLNRLSKKYEFDLPAKARTGIGEAALGGTKRMLSSTLTGLEGIVSPEEAAQAGLERQAGITEGQGADLARIEEAYKQKGLLAAGKETLAQIPGAIAGQVPNLATRFAGARAGAALGVMTPFPEATVPLGALVGAFAPSYLQAAGSHLERQAAEGVPISGSAAYSAAVPSAAIDVFADKIAFGKLLGLGPKQLGTEAAEALARKSLLSTVAAGTGKGILAEVPGEVTQQMLERMQAGLSLTDDDARKEYLQTAAQTAMLGPLGAVSHVMERSQAKRELANRPEEPFIPEGEPPIINPPAPQLPGAPTVEALPQGQPELRAPAPEQIAAPKEPETVTVAGKEEVVPTRPTLVAFPNGQVGTQAEADAYIKSLPEEQQNQARAEMAGLPYSTPPRMVITDADIKEFGIPKNSIAARNLRDLNVSTFENRDFMHQTLEENKGMIKNPEAVETFIAKLPQPTNYTVGAVESILSKTDQEFKNTTQLKKFLVNEIGEDNLNALKDADPKVLSKLLRTSKEKAEEVPPSGGPTDEVSGERFEVPGEPTGRELLGGVQQPDGSGVVGAGSDVGITEEGEVPYPTTLEQAPEEAPKEEPVQAEVTPEITPEEAPKEEPKAEEPPKSIWERLAENGAEQIRYQEEKYGKAKPEPEFVSEEDMTEEEIYAKNKAKLGAYVRQKVGGTEALTPEEEVTLGEALVALADIMYHHVKRGAKNMKDAINRARQTLGDKAKHITQAQFEQAYANAINRHLDEQAMSGFNPKGARDTIDNIGKTIGSFSPASEKLYDGVRNILSNLPDATRKVLMGFYSINDLQSLYGDYVPALKSLGKIMGERASNAYERRHEVEKLVAEGVKVAQKHPKSLYEKFNRITLKLSVENIDPRDPAMANHPGVKAFKSLPKDMQDLAIKYANEYDKYADEFMDLITKSIPEKMGRVYNTQAEKARAKFESGRVKFYHPLRRVGDYWASYKDKNGETVTIARESRKELDDAIRTVRLEGGREFKTYSKLSQISHREAPPTGFIGKILGDMAKAGVSNDVLDQTYQSYLSLFPAESLRQQFRKRTGEAGYINDIVQGFADVGSKMAHQLSQLQYRPDLDKAYNSIEESVRLHPTKELVDLYDEMQQRKEFVDNPIADSVSSKLGYVSYFWNIAGNISSGIVNNSQLPLVVYPLLGGKFGFDKTYTAMKNASKTYLNGGLDDNREFLPDFTAIKNSKLSANHKALFETALSNAALRRSMGYELTEMRRAKPEDYSGTKAKIETLLGWVFQNSERANREITLLAAYDLAKADGASHKEATNYAIQTMIDAHGNTLSEAGPRLFQTGFGKMAFTFKHFAQTQIALLSKLFHRAFAKESPEVRRIARRQLVGVAGSSFIIAGLQGMPLYGAATVLASVLHGLFGDDDEPFDPDEEVREAIGDLGYKGPLNKLLNIDIASRTGFNNMFWREDPRRLAEVGLAPYVAEHFFGPSYQTLFVNPLRAKDLFNQGQTERAVETLLPSFMRNPMKAYRFATEGAQTKNGAKIIDDYSAYNSFMQVMGFSNAELSEAYQRAGSMKQAEKNILNRRSSLLNAAYIARSTGDFDTMMEINDNIMNFNMKYPGMAITGDTLDKSYRGHEQRIRDSVDGVNINAKLKQQIIDDYGH